MSRSIEWHRDPIQSQFQIHVIEQGNLFFFQRGETREVLYRTVVRKNGKEKRQTKKDESDVA